MIRHLESVRWIFFISAFLVSCSVQAPLNHVSHSQLSSGDPPGSDSDTGDTGGGDTGGGDSGGDSGTEPPVVEVPGDLSILHPNEPAGMTPLMYADGSVVEENGRAFGIPGWSRWYSVGERHDPSRVYRVADPGNPTGSGYAVRRHWVFTDSAVSGTADYTYPGGPYRHIYIAQRIIHRGGQKTNHKFYYHIVHDQGVGSNRGPWPTTEGGDTIKLTACGENIIPYQPGPPEMDEQNQEIFLEWHWVAPSSYGANDGEVTWWINGRLVQHVSNVNFSCYTDAPNHLWKGIHFYGQANSTDNEFFEDIREFYVSGRN